MTDYPIDPKMLSRLKDLQAQRTEIFSLPAADALNRILDSDQPAALVHCFPEEDLYFLIHDIGPEDALPLLALASNRQCEYILDLETWDRDRVDIRQTTNWMDLMLRSNPDRFVQWFAEQQADMLEFYLFKTIELKTREHDQHPDDLGDDFFTDDDVYYIRHRDRPFGTVEEDLFQEQRAVFLATFLKQLSAYDHIRFQQILLESAVITPAEYEEEAFRLRNVRLAEKGFLPFDEAVGIYQPLDPARLRHLDHRVTARKDPLDRLLPVPLYSTALIGTGNLFSQSLALIQQKAEKFDADLYAQLQVEFASLSNRIIIADQKIIKDRDHLKNIVGKACGYISIGLEQILRDSSHGPADLREKGADLLAHYPLTDLFRIGYGSALKLKWQAGRWQANSWFTGQGLPLAFWDERWMGTLGGLLIKKPVFYDHRQSGRPYREFTAIGEIDATRAALNQIMAADDLLGHMNLLIKTPKKRFLTYKNLLLTLWARNYLNLPEINADSLKAPLEIQDLAVDRHRFKPFFKALFHRSSDDKPLAPEKISNAMKELFIQWLAKQSGQTEHSIAGNLGQTFESLFTELETEYGQVAAGDLNPRYITHFIITPVS